MAATANLQEAETDTVGPVGVMPASIDGRQSSDARVLAEYNWTCTFQMSFTDEDRALITG